jgi:hypothetical protein
MPRNYCFKPAIPEGDARFRLRSSEDAETVIAFSAAPAYENRVPRIDRLIRAAVAMRMARTVSPSSSYPGGRIITILAPFSFRRRAKCPS